MTLDPGSWFTTFAGNDPYPWQQDLLRDESCPSRLIRIPTGFGKTFGVVGAWAFHRAVRRDPAWPRRLVYCLPMRVLVEQTVDAIQGALRRTGLLRSARNPHGVRVHCLMGGVDTDEWHLDVEDDAVLVGTQDMLLSRALNRGYAAGRARWPVEFGLLHQDALWALDEVQLMDVGLATSAQLEAYRAGDLAEGRGVRPASTWWLSATLQRRWLRSVDSASMVDGLHQLSIEAASRQGHLWDDVAKPARTVAVAAKKADLPERMAREALDAWRASPRGALTLVVVNTVERATAVFQALATSLHRESPPVDLRLVHSRFRPAERAAWREEFLRRDAPIPEGGRIVVATQVVEAGVDLDARLLVTELAPWPSLVQRFGRAARTGGRADILVLDPGFTEDKEAAPYPVETLDASREVLAELADVSPLSLERFEDDAGPARLDGLYPYNPPHLLLRREVDDLFDTTPDLTGADLDVSRYIRSGDERDCTVAWVRTAGDRQPPDPEVQPGRDSLCPVPFLRARTWLYGEKGERLLEGKRAWVWDFLDGRWRQARRSDVVPGRTVLVDSRGGGYDPLRGFDPSSRSPVAPVEPVRLPTAQDRADASQDGEALSESPYKTIATHGAEVATEVTRIADAVGMGDRHRRALVLAARWHDLGKAHPAFQGSIRAAGRPERSDLAKAPDGAWSRAHLYEDPRTRDRRRGFRHELASALALFSVLETHRPGHPALLGPWSEVLGGTVSNGEPGATGPPTPPPATSAERELVSVEDQAFFDLVAYLVASHHGKVRTSLHAAPADQDYVADDGRGLPVRGVREGDVLPPTVLDAGGPSLPALTLTLEPATLGLSERTGRSWADRVLGLLATEGPFALAYLEACLRAADVRASRFSTTDPLLAALEES